MTLSLGAKGRAGMEALTTWPEPVQGLAIRLYAAGVPAHGLPPFGRWLFEELRPGDDLTASLRTSEFARLAKAVLREAGIPTDRVGAHSFRRGWAISLFFDQTDHATVSLALCHRAPQFADAYILDAARVAAVASAMRAAVRGRLDEVRHPHLPGTGSGPAVHGSSAATR